jgi:hypothetical protein
MADSEQLIAALDSRVQRREDRRAFFKAALGAAAVGGAFAVATSAQAQAAVNEVDVLQFALNLEYLEANFYSYAVFGTPVADGLANDAFSGANAKYAGKKVTFKDPIVEQYAREITQDEIAHVKFLRAAIGGTAVNQPVIDVGIDPMGAFSSAARAAKIIGATTAAAPTFFDPYASDENFLLGAFIFEDVGVTAYKGASPLLNTKAYLDAAAGILAAEAYHASIVRTVLNQKGIATPSLKLIESAGQISDARDSLDGADDVDQGIAASNTGVGLTSNIVPTDSNAIAFSRSAGQVLNIVYLSPPATATKDAAGATVAAVPVMKGGFFPNGVNGTIKSGTTA